MKMAGTKLNRSRGFTLGEMLITILILLLATAVSAQAIASARQTYSSVVNKSNAELLLSTSMTVMRDELSSARDIQVDGTNVSYKSNRTGNYARIHLESGSVMITEYSYDSSTSVERSLITEQTATKELSLSYGPLRYDKTSGLLTIPDIKVTSGSAVLAEMDEYLIRTIQ